VIDTRTIGWNDVIRRCGWTALDRSVTITLIPAVL
jgi:hypothetical protein